MKTKAILAAFSILAACLLLNGAYDEWTGVAEASAGRGGFVERASKDTHPREFRNLMTYKWIVAGMWTGAAVFMWQIVRKQESLDVFRPNPAERSSGEKP